MINNAKEVNELEVDECYGCRHYGAWEYLSIMQFDCPCLMCKRGLKDKYERYEEG